MMMTIMIMMMMITIMINCPYLSKIGASNIWESRSEALTPFLIRKQMLYIGAYYQLYIIYDQL